MAKNGNIHPSRIFKSEHELSIVWEEYKKFLDIEALKWVKVQYVGKEGQRMSDPYKLPMTQDGFEIFCYDNYGCVGQYFDNKDNLYSDFVAICSRIKQEIRSNQITGGLLGVYNPSITQRLNGLTDKQEIKQTGNLTEIILTDATTNTDT